MEIRTLNCPNCGANVTQDKTSCNFCNSLLKTEACANCLGLNFAGSKFCKHCGNRTTPVAVPDADRAGDCPRCRVRLEVALIERFHVRPCKRCDGLWIDNETFEDVCASNERQAAVLLWMESVARPSKPPEIRYVPCPDCGELMNRMNFGKSSGVIVDFCRKHGVWTDAFELPKIIEFIRKGGLERQREKEKLALDEKRRELLEDERRLMIREARFARPGDNASPASAAIREFVRFLFD